MPDEPSHIRLTRAIPGRAYAMCGGVRRPSIEGSTPACFIEPKPERRSMRQLRRVTALLTSLVLAQLTLGEALSHCAAAGSPAESSVHALVDAHAGMPRTTMATDNGAAVRGSERSRCEPPRDHAPCSHPAPATACGAMNGCAAALVVERTALLTDGVGCVKAIVSPNAAPSDRTSAPEPPPPKA
jgi:hypothetical protein